MVVVWIVLALLLLGTEAVTMAFFAVFLALGCVGGAVVAGVGGEVWLQTVVTVAVAAAGAVLARPPLVRMMQSHRVEMSLPGVQALVGQRALTVDAVGDEHHPGHALLAGERWLAVTDEGETLAPNVPVTVIAVRGTTLVVRPAAGLGPTSLDAPAAPA